MSTKRKEIEIDLNDLLFGRIMTRVIDDLVRTMAEIISEHDEQTSLLQHEADIYDAISRGCATKAELARALMKPGEPPEQTP